MLQVHTQVLHKILQYSTIIGSNSLQHYTERLPLHNMKVAICCGVYLFGVTGLYFFVVNNQAFIVDPKCHRNMLPTSEGTQLRRMRQRVRMCCFN